MDNDKKPRLGSEAPLFTPRKPAEVPTSNPWVKLQSEAQDKRRELLGDKAQESPISATERAATARHLEEVLGLFQESQEGLQRQSAELQRMDAVFKARQAEDGNHFTVQDLLYYQQTKEKLEAQLADVEGREAALKAREAKVEEYLRVRESSFGNAQSELENRVAELRRQETEFTKEEARAVAHFKALAEQQKETQSALERQGAELQRWEERLRSSEAESGRQFEESAALQGAETELQKRQEHLGQLSAAMNEREASLAACEADVTAREAEVEVRNKANEAARKKAMEELQKRSEDIRRKTEEYVAQQSAAQSSLNAREAEQRAAHEALEGRVVEIKRQEAELQSGKGEVERMRQELESRESELQKLKEELQERESALEKLEERSAELQKLKDELQARGDELQKQTEEFSGRVTAHEQVAAELAERKERLLAAEAEVDEKAAAIAAEGEAAARKVRNSGVLLGLVFMLANIAVFGPDMEWYLTRLGVMKKSQPRITATVERPDAEKTSEVLEPERGGDAGNEGGAPMMQETLPEPAGESATSAGAAPPSVSEPATPAADESYNAATSLEETDVTVAADSEKPQQIAEEPVAPDATGQRIVELLARADVNIANDRLSRPARDNAIKNLRKVLELDPGNNDAREGLIRVAKRYVVLAEAELEKGDFKTMDLFLNKADSLQRELGAGATMGQDLKAARNEARREADANRKAAEPAVQEEVEAAPPQQVTQSPAQQPPPQEPEQIQPPTTPMNNERSDYMERLKATVDSVMIILKDERYAGPENAELRQAVLSDTIFSEFNLPGMCQRAVGRGWRKFTDDQKARFIAVFTQLLEKTYIKLLERYEGEGVKFVKEVKKSENQVRVDSIIATAKQDYKLSFRLYDSPDPQEGWKVIDVIIEGISVVSNYRSQFKNLLRPPTEENIEKLLARLQEKVEHGG